MGRNLAVFLEGKLPVVRAGAAGRQPPDGRPDRLSASRSRGYHRNGDRVRQFQSCEWGAGSELDGDHGWRAVDRLAAGGRAGGENTGDIRTAESYPSDQFSGGPRPSWTPTRRRSRTTTASGSGVTRCTTTDVPELRRAADLGGHRPIPPSRRSLWRTGGTAGGCRWPWRRFTRTA